MPHSDAPRNNKEVTLSRDWPGQWITWHIKRVEDGAKEERNGEEKIYGRARKGAEKGKHTN